MSDARVLKEKMLAAWCCGAEYHWPAYRRVEVYYDLVSALRSRFDRHFTIRPRVVAPESPRRLDVSALFDEQQYWRTVGYQRKLGREAVAALALAGFETRVGRVPRRIFYKTLTDTKVTVSVFGWGEVCYREYEATYAGSAVLMTDMSHVLTYPDFYASDAYYEPFRWDFSDFHEKVAKLIDDDDYRISKARAAQDFLMWQWTIAGKQHFAEYFRSRLVEKDPPVTKESNQSK